MKSIKGTGKKYRYCYYFVIQTCLFYPPRLNKKDGYEPILLLIVVILLIVLQ